MGGLRPARPVADWTPAELLGMHAMRLSALLLQRVLPRRLCRLIAPLKPALAEEIVARCVNHRPNGSGE